MIFLFSVVIFQLSVTTIIDMIDLKIVPKINVIRRAGDTVNVGDLLWHLTYSTHSVLMTWFGVTPGGTDSRRDDHVL